MDVQIRVEDGVARIRVDDGKVNALSLELIEQIAKALDTARAEQAITVLSGREGIFSAGFDLRTFSRGAEAGSAMVAAGARLVERLLQHPLPVITACAGHAYPAGAFLMMAADVRLGVSGPWKIGMNETAIGLTVPQFAIELARHRLAPAGFIAINTATLFDPEAAAQLGYLDRVVAPDELEAAVSHEVARLKGLDLPSFAGTKARINAHVLAALRDAIREEFGAPSEA
jgi:enoyl-CoA hydratase